MIRWAAPRSTRRRPIRRRRASDVRVRRSSGRE
jgi:hypothetical protein